MDVPTSYFGNVAAAAPPSTFNAAVAAPVAGPEVLDPKPKPRRGVNVALYIGLGFAITMVLVAAWWWTRSSLEHENPNTPEALELEDFKRRILAIENPDQRADMEEWLRLCRGSSRPTVHAILIEVLRTNLGPGAGGTAPPAPPSTLPPAEAARPAPAPPFKIMAEAPDDDQLFVRFR